MRRAKHSIQQLATRMARRLKVPVRRPVVVDPLSSEALRSVHAAFGRRKFFILGYPRSGTTLLGRLIRLHPEVHCNWQAHFFTQETSLADLLADEAVEAWLGRPDNRWTSGKVRPAQLVRVACDYIMEREAEARGAWIVGDKSPDTQSYLRLETLRRIYPDAWIVYIVRDGRDVAVSRRYQQFIDQPETMTSKDQVIATELRSQRESAGNRRSIFTDAWLRREAQQWAMDVTRTDSGGSEFFGERYYRLKYEDLLRSPQEAISHLWQFLGVKELDAVDLSAITEEMASNPAAAWHAEAAPSLVAGLARGQHGGWRESFNGSDGSLFEEVAGGAMTRWGYS